MGSRGQGQCGIRRKAASLVAQRLGTCLPVQGAAQPLVLEDPHAAEQLSPSAWSLRSTTERRTKSSPAPRLQRAGQRAAGARAARGATGGAGSASVPDS